ncbi:MAG: ABC transporter ATP-binding protein [Chloroflexi bacterium AL-W]|nr:ABC transporter ATP-binding protein [Chloroflexi bacterium AL-N1]NOK64694.1 ABC transporter ATP-binding protein [Chloroflexi bacterium AL-N10]NOK75935.1 ABC transporter ATP-binding protein [Chloroflexi bacterium AL-N5]NOK80306.1 ABC transporter ATP-binding protein [Chloroflexi bacterium AL-W]NOK86819.1 ABC transporter ATP-binding protein [Chloroflexi bacterium AL-N15]
MNDGNVVINIDSVERVFELNGRHIHALGGITMQIRRGSFVVLMGPSGSGKTTLLNLVGGLDQPTAGQIGVSGQPLSKMGGQELASIRRRIGFIFQSFALMPTASAYENVELGLRIAGDVPRKEWDARIRRCLGAVGLMTWRDHRPYEMSGGQQQRVAIARALAIRPQIILADEPTGDLDSKTGEQILGLLRALTDHEGVTLLMATHDPAAADFATDLYQLRDGQVILHEPRQVFAAMNS